MKIGFFGAGNMGSALAHGMKHEADIYIYSPGKTSAQKLAAEVGGVFIEELSNMPKDLDLYILAFKPQSLKDFNFDFNKSSIVLSVLAGVDIKTLQNKTKNLHIIRLMPNTPSKIGEGANLYVASSKVSENTNNKVMHLLKNIGSLFRVNSESELDLLTVISGSGPALIFEMGRIFHESLLKMNPSFSLSKELVIKTFIGSTKLMESTMNVHSFEELRNQVTSKKGVTFEALEVLRNNQIEQIFLDAFLKGHQRILELQKEAQNN